MPYCLTQQPGYGSRSASMAYDKYAGRGQSYAGRTERLGSTYDNALTNMATMMTTSDQMRFYVFLVQCYTSRSELFSVFSV